MITLVADFLNYIGSLKAQSKDAHSKLEKSQNFMAKYYRNERKETEWQIIQEHSLAKITKNMAEKEYAPEPLPPELSYTLNKRIETSRNQLIRILREQNDIFGNDKTLVI